MVQTRSASGVDVPPPPTPSRPRSSAGTASAVKRAAPRSRRSLSPAASAASRGGASSSARLAHTPDGVTLFWLAVSLPLVTWDTGYVLLRPHTMPGGSLHAPLYTPYALYGEVDHMYGFKQWNAGNGFTSAQGALNLVETLLYLAYVLIWARAAPAAAAPAKARKAIAGRPAAWAVLLLFTATVMTLSKTVLYWLNEYFSGFDNIGHNDGLSLLYLWIIPNGAWLVFPSIILYHLGGEILRALAGPPSARGKKE